MKQLKQLKQLNKQQLGFTLIELVMVIVILGILAATALPKFVNLSNEANQSVADGFGGALSAAASINYAGCAAKNFVVTTDVCVKIATCKVAEALLNPAITFITTVSPTVSKTMYMTAVEAAVAVSPAGKTVICTATYGDGTPAGKTITFTAIGT